MADKCHFDDAKRIMESWPEWKRELAEGTPISKQFGRLGIAYSEAQDKITELEKDRERLAGEVEKLTKAVCVYGREEMSHDFTDDNDCVDWFIKHSEDYD